MISELKTLLLKDLATLRREVEAYPDDASLWRPVPGIANPGGNLALHLAGNLQFFLGEQVGHSGYVRDRDREFTLRDLPRALVLQEVDDAARAVEYALAAMDPALLDQDFPTAMSGRTVSTGLFLLHLSPHLAYHLGQLTYHRRMVTAAG